MMEDFKEECLKLREALKRFEPPIRLLVSHPEAVTQNSAPPYRAMEDMKANIMLAFRHLEDCQMRLGKAVQACDGGISVYPR